MSYSSLAIANSFLELSLGTNVPPMTNMKIQKLVYIAHGFTLGMLHEPLIRGYVHAFQHGPVVPSLYEKLKQFGALAIPGPFSIDVDHAPAPAYQEIIKRVWNKYGQLSAYQLRNITHKPGTPWFITWSTSPYGVISNEIIESYYVNLLAKSHSHVQPA